MRSDLLALDEDALVLLANRGTVRRAAKEAAAVAVEESADGTVVASGDDGVVATLPPGVPVERARCTCAAVVLCRHVVRAVLAYRAAALDAAPVPDAVPGATPAGPAAPGAAGPLPTGSAPAAAGPTDRACADPVATDSGPAASAPPASGSTGTDTSGPVRLATATTAGPATATTAGPATATPAGSAATTAAGPTATTDPERDDRPADLLAALPARVRAAGERLVEAGATATVVRSAAPVVLLHEVGTTVRFLVPDDLAYARCDCRDAAPCAHVVPAVRALRAGGPVVELRRRTPDTGALHGLDTAVALLAEAGAASGQEAVRAVLDRAAVACRGAALTWPADVLAELADLCGRHAVADSGFDPLRLAQLTGEAVLRADTLRHTDSPVPSAFAGGWPAAAETEVLGGRLIGIGTRVRRTGRVVEVDALVYDTGAHRVVVMGRTSVDPAPEDGVPVPSYAELASATLQKGITIAAAGAGQLVATGGRRTPEGRLRFGRRPAALGPQRFDWTGVIGAPVLVEGAAGAAGVVSATFPAPIGLRSVGTGVVVVPVTEVTDAGFDPAAQAVTATLVTADGGVVGLVHPHSSRAAGGTEALLHGLTAGGVRFVAGVVAAQGSTTVVRPCGVVVEDPAGARRLVAPWTDPAPSTGTVAGAVVAATPRATPPSRQLPTVADHVLELQAETGALLTTGVARADRTVRAAWAHLAEHADALGSTVLAPRVEAVAAALAVRAADPGWTPAPAAAALLRLAAALELARPLALAAAAPARG